MLTWLPRHWMAIIDICFWHHVHSGVTSARPRETIPFAICLQIWKVWHGRAGSDIPFPILGGLIEPSLRNFRISLSNGLFSPIGIGGSIPPWFFVSSHGMGNLEICVWARMQLQWELPKENLWRSAVLIYPWMNFPSLMKRLWQVEDNEICMDLTWSNGRDQLWLSPICGPDIGCWLPWFRIRGVILLWNSICPP